VSINIGTEAVNAVIELRANRDFERLLTALSVLTQTRMLGAMNSPVDHRTDATAYARGMYDLWEAMEAARLGVQISQVKPPPLTRRAKEDVNA
jgi:hypothetical protein